MDKLAEHLARIRKLGVQLAVAAAILFGLRAGVAWKVPEVRTLATFAQKWSGTSTFGTWEFSLARTAPASGRRGWPWIVKYGRVSKLFGWNGANHKTAFNPGITIIGTRAETVTGGPGGSVVRAQRTRGQWHVVLAVHPHVILTFRGLASVRIRPGERIHAGAVIGRLGASPLRIEVLDRGYPVNPLQTEFFSRSGQP